MVRDVRGLKVEKVREALVSASPIWYQPMCQPEDGYDPEPELIDFNEAVDDPSLVDFWVYEPNCLPLCHIYLQLRPFGTKVQVIRADGAAAHYYNCVVSWCHSVLDKLQAQSPKDSGHFHYPPEMRRQIVLHYRKDKALGRVAMKEQWAQNHYNMTGRTLLSYEKEFPPEREGNVSS